MERLNKFAKSKGFAHIQHYINHINKSQGTNYKTFEEIPKKLNA